MRNVFLIFNMLLWGSLLSGQSYQVPLGHNAYHVVDRLDILSGGVDGIHTSLKYYTREELSELANLQITLSELDKGDLNYIRVGNSEFWPTTVQRKDISIFILSLIINFNIIDYLN